MSNLEKIKQLPDYELAYFLSRNPCRHCIYDNGGCDGESCTFGIEDWLNLEVVEDDYPKHIEVRKSSKRRI